MNRIPDRRYSEVIGHAFTLIPPRIADMLSGVQFVCGVDPVFAGLHDYDDMDDDRSYRRTAHCCYPFHLTRPASDRVTTVMIPTLRDADPKVVVHELGHALDWRIGRKHMAQPTTWYAETNRMEAFAEAFSTLLIDGYGDSDVLQQDKATLALFETLASSP